MKISVFYPHIMDAVKQSGQNLNEVLAKVRGDGIEGIECDIASLRSDGQGFCETLKRADLLIASVYATYNFENQCDMDSVKRDVDAIVACGCRKTLVIPGFVHKEQENRREELLARIMDGLTWTTEYAVGQGLTVSLEDYDNSIAPFSTIQGLQWFMEGIDSLGFTFDTGNFLYSEESALDAFEQLGSRLVHVHCKDRSLTSVQGETPLITVGGRELYTAPVGYGCIPMEQCVALVKRTGYDGWISIEHFGALDQLEYIRKSAAWLRAEWGK